MKKTVLCIAYLACALLSACGGGGSGGNPGSAPDTGGVITPTPINNDPCLTLSPSPLNLTLEQGSVVGVTVHATASCNFPDVVNVGIFDSKGVISPQISVTPVSQYEYYVQVRTATGLAAGTYDGILEIRLCKDDPLACKQPHKGSPWRLPYHIQVNLPVSWSIQTPPAMVATAGSTLSSLNAQTAINLAGSAPLQWRAAVSGAPWLKLVNASGLSNSSSLQVAVDQAEFAKLANFSDYTAVVTISTDAANVPPTTTTVTLKKAIAELNFAGPATVLPGQSTTIHLHGHGFNSLSNLAGALQISGINASNAKLVSDSEITVQVSAGSGDIGRFSISNVMGLDTGAATVKAVAAASYGYQALASEGYKGTLRFDVERQALLLVNRAQGKVLRYAYNGSSWLPSSVAITGADDAGLSPDGKSLVVSSTSGLLSLLDPATLALQASFQGASEATSAYVSSRLAVTNDGRAWFPTAVGSVAYFDLRTRQFGSPAIGDYTNYYFPQAFSLSSDGEHLVLVPMSMGSPAPPVQYLSTSDGVFRNSPDANFTLYSTASQNRDGSRMIFDDIEVRDSAFKTLGRFAISDGSAYAGGYSYGSVISPDGSRSYVMYLGPQRDPNMKPRIYVFDTSAAVSDVFPLLGYFDITDSPTSCMQGDYCDPRMSTVISPDGKTLFFAGNKNLLVIPVPAILQH